MIPGLPCAVATASSCCTANLTIWLIWALLGGSHSLYKTQSYPSCHPSYSIKKPTAFTQSSKQIIILTPFKDLQSLKSSSTLDINTLSTLALLYPIQRQHFRTKQLCTLSKWHSRSAHSSSQLSQAFSLPQPLLLPLPTEHRRPRRPPVQQCLRRCWHGSFLHKLMWTMPALLPTQRPVPRTRQWPSSAIKARINGLKIKPAAKKMATTKLAALTILAASMASTTLALLCALVTKMATSPRTSLYLLASLAMTPGPFQLVSSGTPPSVLSNQLPPPPIKRDGRYLNLYETHCTDCLAGAMDGLWRRLSWSMSWDWIVLGCIVGVIEKRMQLRNSS